MIRTDLREPGACKILLSMDIPTLRNAFLSKAMGIIVEDRENGIRSPGVHYAVQALTVTRKRARLEWVYGSLAFFGEAMVIDAETFMDIVGRGGESYRETFLDGIPTCGDLVSAVKSVDRGRITVNGREFRPERRQVSPAIAGMMSAMKGPFAGFRAEAFAVDLGMQRISPEPSPYTNGYDWCLGVMCLDRLQVALGINIPEILARGLLDELTVVYESLDF